MHKRGNGQGTARKRGSTWTAIWTVGFSVDDAGRLHQITKTKGGFRTKTAALAYAANPDRGEKQKAKTLQYYWQDWSKGDMTKLSSSKQTAYKIAWKKLASVAYAPIDSLTIRDLQQVVTGQELSFYPARDVKSLLSHLYRRAIAEEQVRSNLPEWISLPKLEEKELEPFTEEELARLWECYGAGDWFLGFPLVMIYSGMMPGELLALEEPMIHWDKREIIGCGLKTKKRQETPIVFPSIIDPVLRDLCARSQSRLGRVVGINRDAFYARYHESLRRAGVRDLPPYSCRHTTATALALGNIAPSVIQEAMRHTKFTTTQRYIHPDTAATHAAIETMKKAPAPPPDAGQ